MKSFCRNRVNSIALLVATLLLCAAHELIAAEFRAIPATSVTASSPYTWSQPVVTITALSGDGSTIAGTVQNTGVIYDCAAYICGIEPFMWSWNSESPPTFFPAPVPLHFATHTSQAYPKFARSLSHDGQASLLVAEYRHYESAIYREGQPSLLRPNAIPQQWLWGADMSADGSVVVGNEGEAPFRWDESSGLKPIDGLPDGFSYTATRVSGDGRVSVLTAQPGISHGVILLDPDAPRGNTYTSSEEAGLMELPPLAGDDFSVGHSTSFDGTTVVGTSNVLDDVGSRGRAVRWRNGELDQLTPFPGLEWSTALDVTANGRVSVGEGFNQDAGVPRFRLDLFEPNLFPPAFEDTTARAVVWNSAGEVFDLKNLLAKHHELGAQLDGWLLTSATLISDDGRTIAGQGINPAGTPESWVLRLDRPLIVPEPSSLLILATGLIFSASYRARSCVALTQRS